MSITYGLGFEPIWILVDQNGTAAGAGRLYSYRSLNKSEGKLIYTDPAGQEPFTNPILFDANGVAPGPFYFEVDSGDPDETYFLQAYNGDKDNGGLLLWEADDYLPGGSGGGSNVTEFLPLVNYIANNQFINPTTVTTTTSLTSLVVAPSNHQGFTPYNATNPLIGTYGALGPDIMFLKSSTANTDSITFPSFTFGSADLTPDVTPPRYLNYACSTSNAGETYKCFQFPITQKVVNLSNQSMTFRIWAKATSGTPIIKLYTRQYYGSSTGATAESSSTRQLIDSKTLSGTWTLYTISFTMPNVSGKTLGTPGLMTEDDAVYLQLEVPLNTACGINFTKPALYLGDVTPSVEFEDYDEINSINSTPRTGDIKTSLLPNAPLGWVAMDDGSIGNVGSGATNFASANAFQLYATIYTSVIDAWAPVSTGRTGGGNTVANAIADFKAGKTLTLPRSLGRALAGAGSGSGLTARVLGQYVGTSETYQLQANDLPAHVHPAASGAFIETAGGGGFAAGSSGLTSSANTGNNVTTNTAISLMQPTSFMNVFIKL